MAQRKKNKRKKNPGIVIFAIPRSLINRTIIYGRSARWVRVLRYTRYSNGSLDLQFSRRVRGSTKEISEGNLSLDRWDERALRRAMMNLLVLDQLRAVEKRKLAQARKETK